MIEKPEAQTFRQYMPSEWYPKPAMDAWLAVLEEKLKVCEESYGSCIGDFAEYLKELKFTKQELEFTKHKLEAIRNLADENKSHIFKPKLMKILEEG
jgi:hypothetical protein